MRSLAGNEDFFLYKARRVLFPDSWEEFAEVNKISYEKQMRFVQMNSGKIQMSVLRIWSF
jgi:hypothetical protein